MASFLHFFPNSWSCVLFSFFQEADSDPTGEAAANTQQTLTFYELDLGLNHVVRKYSEALEEHGNFLITGEHFGPCGLHSRDNIGLFRKCNVCF